MSRKSWAYQTANNDYVNCTGSAGMLNWRRNAAHAIAPPTRSTVIPQTIRNRHYLVVSPADLIFRYIATLDKVCGTTSVISIKTNCTDVCKCGRRKEQTDCCDTKA
ncbi:hypothetical protein XAC3607_2220001 [Xanthomonas citri pv. citri]|nr:hypothetical protein XAC3615_7820001 [Xanthomonas citri pv. citri]CEH77817.1 hypothetical protein XAC3607_2220001 [Xanthomonas citri pv. citri]